MVDKSGFEIRADLLGMAIGILDNQRSQRTENEHMKPEGHRQPVDPFSDDEVLKLAEKLYGFVQRKK